MSHVRSANPGAFPGLAPALDKAARHLVSKMNAEGFWEGRLSSSALSTATAISALAPAGSPADRPLIESGLAWLARTQNPDGGWGDTPDSPSNLSTTILAICSIKIGRIGPIDSVQRALSLAEGYVTARAGVSVPERVSAIRAIYGEDRTFATPILMNCALAGLVPWSEVPPLPFELALCPRALYRALRLHVVSYALPALIAVGAVIHSRNPTSNPVVRALRNGALRPVLAKLSTLQPASGGFLEAVPLTSFVGMSLVALVGPDHPVAAQCLRFLRSVFRPDGSWPIDSNLAVWVTTGAFSALAHAGALERIDAARTRAWIAARQWRTVHPFTGAAPGAFAWTHLSGGVPDADDTAGAILALGNAEFGMRNAESEIAAAVNWLLDLQNTDGGWPTFCRGWGKLPFDRSAPDLTAHVLRALLSVPPAPRIRRAIDKGFQYLAATQRHEGSWSPLWFGNQYAPRHENPVLGTARVLLAWAVRDPAAPAARRGLAYLLGAQNPDGGWGGATFGNLGDSPRASIGTVPETPESLPIPSTIEETAQAVSALARFDLDPGAEEILARGVHYLVGRVEDDSWTTPAPIGLYFASLWYSEELYPVIWTLEALAAAGRARIRDMTHFFA